MGTPVMNRDVEENDDDYNNTNDDKDDDDIDTVGTLSSRKDTSSDIFNVSGDSDNSGGNSNNNVSVRLEPREKVTLYHDCTIISDDGVEDYHKRMLSDGEEVVIDDDTDWNGKNWKVKEQDNDIKLTVNHYSCLL